MTQKSKETPIETFLGIRRRKYLIHPRFQYTITGFNVALAGLLILLMYGENKYLFSKFTETQPELMNDPIIVQMVAEEKARLYSVLGISSAIILAVMMIGGMILSNRVAGPVYRLRKHMEDILSGKVSGDVHFREKDFFPELADTFNKVHDHYKAQAKVSHIDDSRKAG